MNIHQKFVLFYILAALALLGIAGARNSTNDFRNECVSAHNKYREIHGAGALEWNDQLAAKADELARECPDMVVPTGYEKAAHSASVSIGYDNVTAAINSIYAARKHYNFATGHWNRKIGHFTLVVWRGSRYLGCAVKLCPQGLLYAFEYDTGNVDGQFVSNVRPDQLPYNRNFLGDGGGLQQELSMPIPNRSAANLKISWINIATTILTLVIVTIFGSVGTITTLAWAAWNGYLNHPDLFGEL